MARRLYVGRGRSRAATVALGDPQGRTRLRLGVDSTGTASLDFLDEGGRVVYSLLDSAGAPRQVIRSRGPPVTTEQGTIDRGHPPALLVVNDRRNCSPRVSHS